MAKETSLRLVKPVQTADIMEFQARVRKRKRACDVHRKPLIYQVVELERIELTAS